LPCSHCSTSSATSTPPHHHPLPTPHTPAPARQVKDTPDAPETAKKELAKLGPLSRDEKITAGAFALTVALWIFGGSIGVNAVAAATVGLFILLVRAPCLPACAARAAWARLPRWHLQRLSSSSPGRHRPAHPPTATPPSLAPSQVTGVTSWKECLNNNGAWDTLTWFAALIAMAAYLNKFGFIPWFSNSVVQVRQLRLRHLLARPPGGPLPAALHGACLPLAACCACAAP
jgi:hypothetical protein